MWVNEDMLEGKPSFPRKILCLRNRNLNPAKEEKDNTARDALYRARNYRENNKGLATSACVCMCARRLRNESGVLHTCRSDHEGDVWRSR